MYSPLQIEIIKAFGSKQLSEGCLIETNSGKIFKFLYMEAEEPIKWIYNRAYYIWQDLEHKKDYNGANIMKYASIDLKILWHIPHLNDLYRVAESKDWIIKVEYNYLKREYVWITIDNTFWEDDIYALIPYNPTLDLIDQDPELTLLPLLNLFK